MENLGWWIYLCSVIGGIYNLTLITFIVCLLTFIATCAIYCDDNCEIETAKKWWKYTGIIGIISMTFVIFTPQKSDCYHIFGITVATEVIKNSEALQELPEKSFEAINRFLDSIAPKDEEK
nr:MAG TPA: Integrin alpha-1 Alpha1, Transmembrane Region, Detergent [Crassvirales sp.]